MSRETITPLCEAGMPCSGPLTLYAHVKDIRENRAFVHRSRNSHHDRLMLFASLVPNSNGMQVIVSPFPEAPPPPLEDAALGRRRPDAKRFSRRRINRDVAGPACKLAAVRLSSAGLATLCRGGFLTGCCPSMLGSPHAQFDLP
jgi:hypothetical protein